MSVAILACKMRVTPVAVEDVAIRHAEAHRALHEVREGFCHLVKLGTSTSANPWRREQIRCVGRGLYL